jgi:type 1 fimbria pilin
LEHGVISPASKREELVVLAKQKLRETEDRASEAANKASEVVSSAWYAATDAPVQAYDFTQGKVDGKATYTLLPYLCLLDVDLTFLP